MLVDESQDTTEGVVAALKSVASQMERQFCLGFFGDPMQRIYVTGGGDIAVEDGWHSITKPENFRCPTSVLTVANAIRRDGDGLVQTRGRTVKVGDLEQPVAGTARIFIMPADEHREERICRSGMDSATKWGPDMATGARGPSQGLSDRAPDGRRSARLRSALQRPQR